MTATAQLVPNRDIAFEILLRSQARTNMKNIYMYMYSMRMCIYGYMVPASK